MLSLAIQYYEIQNLYQKFNIKINKIKMLNGQHYLI
jgi:hypothetical protein